MHWYFVGKSDRKLEHIFLLLLSLPYKLYFCRGVKGNGKGTEERIATAGQCSLLAYFGCFYFRFLTMGISLPLLKERQAESQAPLPHSDSNC